MHGCFLDNKVVPPARWMGVACVISSPARVRKQKSATLNFCYVW